MYGKICRLCLQTISEDCQEMIGETFKNMLKLDLSISEETVTCMECTNNFKLFLDLRSACVDMSVRVTSLNDLKNDDTLDLVKIENTNNLKSFTEPKDDIRCSFCIKSTGKASLISLYESKTHIYLVDILERHIPELNSSNNGELLTCEICLDRMRRISSFLLKCSEVEEKISKYVEKEGTDDKGLITLQNVQQFIFIPTLKFEGDSCHVNELREAYGYTHEEFTMKTESEITFETEMSNPEPLIKTEDVDIKCEQSDCDSSQEPHFEVKLDNEQNSSDTVYKCDKCTYETTLKSQLYDHVFAHKNHSGREMFKYEKCTFETESKQNLKQYKSKHQSPSQKTMFKCGMCEYKTKRNHCLKTHMLIHKSSSEVTMYKCDSCTYETKYKFQLNDHKLAHKDPTEITMLKCALCSFQAKRKRNLNHHMLFRHKKFPDTTLYKCESCTYETRYKLYLNRHKLVHKSPSEVIMYKCNTCTYETKRRNVFKAHILIHKGPAELTMFSCGICAFKTKHKRNLKGHMLTHKSSEASKAKCKMCAFETIYKSGLKRHMLVHRSPSEVRKYECESCKYKTDHKYKIKKHKLVHKSCKDVAV